MLRCVNVALSVCAVILLYFRLLQADCVFGVSLLLVLRSAGLLGSSYYFLLEEAWFPSVHSLEVGAHRRCGECC